MNSKSIVESLLVRGYGRNANSTLEDIDGWLMEKKKTICLILLNFCFDRKEFANLSNIKIIGTIENIDIKVELEELETFNFIFRDLTTFEDYEDEIMGADLEESKVQTVLMILGNLSDKSKAVFRALLKLGSCTIRVLFDSIKRELFIAKSMSMVELLKEFIDHKIIKIQENRIILHLNEQEKIKLLEAQQ